MASYSKQGVCHGRVIVDCDFALKTHLKLEKIVPAMVEVKLFTKKAGKVVRKQKDMELFLALLKDKPFSGFLTFLKVLQSLGKEDKDVAKLMKIMSGALKQLDCTDQTALDTISSFIQASVEYNTGSSADKHLQTQEDSRTTNITLETETCMSDKPTISNKDDEDDEPMTDVKMTTDTPPEEISLESLSIHQSAPSTAALQAHRPPPGFIGECKSRSFSQEGGMLYLSEHGVTVIIPPGAVSLGEKFVMSVHVYLRGPFSLPEDVEPCSAIVWFGVMPPTDFQKDITVKIPHAAVVEGEHDCSDECSVSEFGVYRAPRDSSSGLRQLGQVYQLTEHIPADFQDGYHAIFKVRHFSPYMVGKQKDDSNEQTSSKKSSSNLHVVESRKQLLSSGKLSQRLRSYSSSVESQGSFEDSDASGNSSPMLSTFRNNPNVEVTSPPLSSSVSSDVFDGEPSSMQFSRRSCGAGKKRLTSKKKTNPKSSKLKKQQGGKIKFCVGLCTPSDRSTQEWEATFAVCYNHTTAISALRKYASVRYGEGANMEPILGIRFNTLELTPGDWTSADNHWTVRADKTPLLSKQDVLMQLPSHSLLQTDSESFCKEAASLLPNVTYSVQSSSSPPSSSLRCRVDVCGAVNSLGEEVFFTLKSHCPKKTAPATPDIHPSTSSVQHVPSTSRTLRLTPYLYDKTSDVVAALESSSTDLWFDLNNPDHIKFLANLSSQLATIDLRVLNQLFNFQENYPSLMYSCSGEGHRNALVEAIYNMLSNWVTRNIDGASPSLKLLKDKLKGANLFIYLSDHPCNSELCNILLHPQFDSMPVPEETPETFLLNVGQKIQHCWRQIGRLMGIGKTHLDRAEFDNPSDIYEQSYRMLIEWRRRCGLQAHLGVLFRAVKCTWDQDPSVIQVNDATCYLVNEAGKILQQLGISY